MEKNSLLNISQLSNEVDSGEAIIKFLVRRFEKWLPGINHNGQKCYPPDILITLIILLDKINKGVLPSAIEKEFKNNLIQPLLLSEQTAVQPESDLQERYVKALEKRNEIEILKVDALNNIANRFGNFDASLLPQPGKEVPKEQITTDDLSLLIDTADKKEKSIERPLIDDLSMLLEKTSDNGSDIDDLSVLLEPVPNKNSNAETDDLSKLIENDTKPETIDNLSHLLDTSSESDHEIDDLSLLIQTSDQKPNKIDDLSLLTNELDFKNGTMDDLSALVDAKTEEKISMPIPKFSPKDDFESYKSEIINIIIDLKNQELSEEETCELFNKKGILTFSGKTSWSVKTVSQVYQLINNAA
jgi:hypothetical protein